MVSYTKHPFSWQALPKRLTWAAQWGKWLGCQISDQGVPVSNPGRCTFRCGLEQVTFTPCLVLVKPRKGWMDD